MSSFFEDLDFCRFTPFSKIFKLYWWSINFIGEGYRRK